MSRSLIVFVIICALGIGSVLVYSKNNIKPGKPEAAKQELSKFKDAAQSASVENPLQNQIQSQAQSQVQNPTPIKPIPVVTELKIEDIKAGTGTGVKDGDSVEVNYIGALLDGRKFDSSYDRHQTFSFTVGTGRVIKGWDQGLIGMKAGGKRKLLIPSDLAYGPTGNGPIPPNTPLYFEIELVSIKAQ